MAKRKAGSPLQFLSGNEPLRATRRSSRLKNVSQWPHGKENENGRGAGTPFESPLKISELRQAELSSSKRSRLGVDASRNSEAPPRGHKKKKSPEERSLSESRVSTFRKDNSSAERPLGGQLTKCLCAVDGHCRGTFQNQHDFTEVTPVHSRGPDKVHCCHTYTRRGKSSTSTAASPSRLVAEEREISSRNRSIHGSVSKDVETRHESTREGKGSNEDETVKFRGENNRPATEKGKESALLPVQPNSVCRYQVQIDQIGNNTLRSEDQGVELISAYHHLLPLEDPVRTRALDTTKNDCRDNVRDQMMSSKTEDTVPVNTKNNRDSDGKERTHRVLDGTVQGNGQRYHHSLLQDEPVRTIALDITKDGSRDNVRDQITPSKTEKTVPVNTRNNRDSDVKERTHGVLDGTVQGNGQRCHHFSPVARADMDAEGPVQVLEEAYRKLYEKYRRSETKNMAQVEAIYDEQTRRFVAFTTAADAVVEKLREENKRLVRQLQDTGVEESVHRSRQLEDEFIECKNELVMERSKVLELERELRDAHLYILELRTSCSHMRPVANSTPSVPPQQSRDLEASQVANSAVEIADRIQPVDVENLRFKSHSALFQEQNEITKTTALGVDSRSFEKEPSAEGSLRHAEEKETEGCPRQPDLETFATGPGGNKLLNELLQSLTQMSTVVDRNLCQITFTHDESGFSFKLEQNELSREVAGDDALRYQVIAPGTIVRLGPAWMQSEIVFDITQARSFFERILTVARRCPCN